MREPVFTGVCPALVTPFDTNGAVNYEALGVLIDLQLKAGVDAVCVAGTTGESSTLSTQEYISVIEYSVKHIDKRVKVIAGAGCNDTLATVCRCRQALDSGADALLLVTPYYNKTNQTGLVKHYEYIADHIDLPIILYNVPSRTGLSFTAESYKILAENTKVNGVKEASGDINLITQTRYLCGDDFYVWSGNDDQVVSMMSLGAKGVISVVCNLCPRLMANITHACLSGDFNTASKLQIKYIDLIHSLFIDVNPIPIKFAMNLAGMNAGQLRLPLYELSEENQKILKSSMIRCGLLK